MMCNLHHRPVFWFSCCVIFLYFSISIAAIGSNMFADTDPLWHIATGDLIRGNHGLPAHDTWSFTAGNYHWINISWAWDITFSYIHEQLGWHGAVAINSIIVALIITIIYATCLIRSGNFIASIITVISAASLLSIHLRPLQFSNLMVASWMLLLGAVMRERIKPCWLFVLPSLMFVWVNVHGGFLIGILMLAAFLFQAMYERKKDLSCAILLTLMTSVMATTCNPYGVNIWQGAMRSMTSDAAQFIHEWQPFVASPHNLLTHFYAVAFLILVPRRNLPILTAERWLAYMWLLLGLISNRNLSIFTIISAPIVACSLQGYLSRLSPIPQNLSKTIREATLFTYNRRPLAIVAWLLCLCACLWLPTPMAARAYGQENIAIANLNPEIDFIKAHIPKARLLTHFDLGGILLYQTRGDIPVFIDPRCETAYPKQVVKDYVKFLNSEPGWEKIMDNYSMDGVMMPNTGYEQLYELLQHRNGWKLVFKGPVATIFMRTP